MLAHTRKRILSMFLAFAMVLGMLPTSVFASEAEPEAGRVIELKVGESRAVEDAASSDQEDEWSSLDAGVAAVEDGVVTGVAVGETTITHTYYVAAEVQAPPVAPTLPAVTETLPVVTETLPAVTETPPAATEIPGETPPAATEIPGETPPAATEVPGETPPAATETPNETPPATTEEPGETPPAATEEPGETPPAATEEPGETPPAATEEPGEKEEPDASEPPAESGNTGDADNSGSGGNTGDTDNSGSGENTGDADNTGSGDNTGDADNSESGENTGDADNSGSGGNAGDVNPADPMGFSVLAGADVGVPDAPSEETAPAEGDAQPAEDETLPAEPETGDDGDETPAVTVVYEAYTESWTVIVTASVEGPAIEGTAVHQGVTVHVYAPENVFPEGTVLNIAPVLPAEETMAADVEAAPVDAETVESAVAAAMEAEPADPLAMVAFDITFRDAEGNELQPADGRKVSVTFDVAAESDLVSGETAQLQVFHVDADAQEAEAVGDAVAVEAADEAQQVVVEAESFSIYVVTGVKHGENGILKITPGQTVPLTGKGSSYRNHNWSPDKPNVATVKAWNWPNNEKATVTAVSPGTATITHTWGTSKYNKETFTVTVAEGYQVTFDDVSGKLNAREQVVVSGEKATNPVSNNPSWGHCAFGGWYTDAACETAFDFNTPITADITLYAKWTATAKVYTLLTNKVPDKDEINRGWNANQFGPSRDDTPYFIAHVNMTKLLHTQGVARTSGDYWYISIATKGCGDSVEALWTKIFNSMDTASQKRFTDYFPSSNKTQGSFVGYVLKQQGDSIHIDGVTTYGPPAYQVDVAVQLDGDETAHYLEPLFVQNVTDPDVEAKKYADVTAYAQTYLEGLGATVEWNTGKNGGTYTLGGATYDFTLAITEGTLQRDKNTINYVEKTKNSLYRAQFLLTSTRRQAGSLTIEKKWSGIGGAPEGFAATFNVYSGNSTSGKPVATKSWSTDFTDGKCTISNLTPGTYTVVETINRNGNNAFYEFTRKTNGTATVVDRGTVTATVTNTYTPKAPTPLDNGRLTITKTFEGVTESLRPATVSVTVTGPSGYRNNVTLEKSKGYTIELTDLKPGTYTVTETFPTIADYHEDTSKTVKTGTATLTTTGDPDANNRVNVTSGSVTLTNVYARNQAALNVQKNVSGLTNLPDGYKVTLIVKEGGSTVGSVTFAKTPRTGEHAFGTSVKVADVPVGEHTYTIEESVSGTGVDEDGNVLSNGITYTLSATGTGEKTVKVKTNIGANLEVTNTYTASTGKLTVTKVFEGDRAAWADEEITLNLKKDNRTVASSNIPVPMSGSETTYTFEDVAPGTYTVEESGQGEHVAADYRWVEEKSTTSISNIVVQAGETTTARTKLKNVYEPLGSLSITKEVKEAANSQPAPKDDEFTFTVTLDDKPYNSGYNVDNINKFASNGKITLKAGQTATITGIPYGTSYSVTEAAKENYTTDKAEHTGTVNATTANPEVTVTNTYFKSKTTTVSGTKTWVDEKDQPVTANLPQSITVQLYRTYEGNSTAEKVGDAKTVTISDKGTWVYDFGQQPTHKDSKTGYRYYVEETNVTYAKDDKLVNEVKPSSGNFIVYGKHTVNNAADGGREVLGVWVTTVDGTDITNKWVPAENIADVKFPFTVKKTDGEGNLLSGATFELKLENKVVGIETTDERGIANFGALEPGVYTLTETNAPTGYQKSEKTWTVTISADKDLATLTAVSKVEEETNTNVWRNVWNWLTGASASGDNATLTNGVLTITNNKIQGKISITKAVTGGFEPGHNDSYIFNIYAGADATGTLMETLTVKASETKITKDLPYGTYTIVEKTPTNAGDNFTYSGVTYTGGKGAAVDNAYQVKVEEQGATVAVTATNAYERKTADLTIEKKVTTAEDVTAPTGDIFTFTVAFGTGKGIVDASKPNTYVENGSYTFDLKAGETFTITGVPYGETYTVTEAETEGYTTTTPEIEGTFTGAKTETVTNYYVTHGFSINKVDNDGALITNNSATFALYSDAACENEVFDAITTGDAGIASVQNLPVGIYYLQETEAPTGYDPSGSVWKVTVTTDGVQVEKANVGILAKIAAAIIGNSGDLLEDGKLTVANTPVVTKIEKWVADKQYDTEEALDSYTWRAETSFTGLAPHTTTVTALFKVTLTGAPGADLADFTDRMDQGATVSLVEPETMPEVIPEDGSVTLYYTSTLTPTTTSTIYTNTASLGELSGSAKVTVAKERYPGLTVTVRHWFQNSYGVYTVADGYSQKTDYADRTVNISQGGTVAAANYVAASLPDGYAISKVNDADPASITYEQAYGTDGTNGMKVIDIYYDLEMTTTDFTVAKVWDHGEEPYQNPEDLRPETVTVKLQQREAGEDTAWTDVTDDKGAAVTATLYATEGAASEHDQTVNKYTWTGLPLYVEGEPVGLTYRAVETQIGAENVTYSEAVDGREAGYYAGAYRSTYASGEDGVISNTYVYTTSERNTATFNIKKLGVGDVALNGATFTLYDSDVPAADNAVASGTTADVVDEEGTRLESGLAAITIPEEYLEDDERIFYLKETTAPAGYHLDDTVWTVKVSMGEFKVIPPTSGNVFEHFYEWMVSLFTGGDKEAENWQDDRLTVIDQPITRTDYDYESATVTLRKTDGTDPITESPATFTLTNMGKAEDTFTAETENGVAEITFSETSHGLAANESKVYAITETTAPAGYQAAKGDLGYVQVTRTSDTAWKDNVYVTTITYTAAIYSDSACKEPAELNDGALDVVNGKLVDVTAVKAWADTTGGAINAPQGSEVTFTLFQREVGTEGDFTATEQTVVLDGAVDENGETAGWTATWTGLSPDYDYEVRETEGHDGYTAAATVEDGATVITNRRDAGSLTITKALTEGYPAEAASKEYRFTITGPADVDGTYTVGEGAESETVTFTDGTAEVTITGAGSKTIADLPTGTYNVTEDDANDIPYWTWGKEGDGEVAVENKDTATMTVTNTYTQRPPEETTSTLTITKAVQDTFGDDLRALASGQTYTFQVTGTDVFGAPVNETVSIDGAGSKTVKLTYGTYTVTEVEPAAHGIEGYTWSGVAYTGNEGIALGEDGASVAATNTYAPEPYGLTVTKTWSGHELPDDFDITISNADRVGSPIVLTTDDADEYDAATRTYAWHVEGLLFGETYIFSENNYRVSGYSLDAEVRVPALDAEGDLTSVSAGSTSGNFALTDLRMTDGGTVAFDNSYSRNTTPPTPPDGPDEPDEPDRPDRPRPTTTPAPSPVPTTEIPEPETPLAPGPEPEPAPEVEIGEPETPLAPAPDPEETDILEVVIPQGNLPQTGTAAHAVDPTVTLGLLALSLSMAAAGLAITIGRKKEEEIEE